MGMANGGSKEELNYIAHIIRDVFPWVKNGVLHFGSKDHRIVKTLRSPEHSIEAWGLRAGASGQGLPENTFAWQFDLNATHFGPNFCNLFIAFNMNPELKYGNSDSIARRVHQLMKPNGFVWTVNPGQWAYSLHKYLIYRMDLANEIDSFAMFHGQNIAVFQKQ